MDFIPSKGREIVIDIDRCIDTGREVGNPVLAAEKMGNVVPLNECGMLESVDEVVRGENSGSLKPVAVDEISQGAKKKSKRAKGKPVSVSKPPRPPRGLLSLDAADEKLIKEIAELAMIKRAKIERMKKMRAAKASSSSASSGGNLMAMLFTVIFFLVIILQGCHTSHGNKSSTPIQGSSDSSTVTDQQNLFANSVPVTSIESLPNFLTRYRHETYLYNGT